MKLIKPSYKILSQEPTLEGVYKQIEHSGRICYASESKEGITSEQFVQRLINSFHLSPLEHGTIYLYFPWVSSGGSEKRYYDNKYSKCTFYSNQIINSEKTTPIEYGKAGYYAVSNFRVLVENDWLDDLQYLCKPTKYHEKRISVEMICDIGVSREANRHRSFSVSEQSTRYCNFSKDKFGEEITFIEPCWNLDSFEGEQFKLACTDAERRYMQLIEGGWKPQQARSVLSLSTATKVLYTAFESDWKHFFKLRCDVAAHPQMRELAIPLREEMLSLGYKV